MHGFNISIPSKVLVVECQNALYAMYPHRGHEACVVNLHTGDAVRYQKFAPLFVNGKAVREQTKLLLEKLAL